MNGWHRLWLVAVVLMALLAAAWCWYVWPAAASVPHRESFLEELTPLARERLAKSELEAGTRVRMPNGYVVALKPGTEPTETDDPVLQYHYAVSRVAAEKQKETVTVVAGAWLTASFLLLAAGRAFAWVRRGFEAGKNAT